MIDLAPILNNLPRSVSIEAIYLASHELTEGLPSPLRANVGNSALTSNAQKRARKAAKDVLKRVEESQHKSLGNLSRAERSHILNNLYNYLVSYTSYGADVRERAQIALREMEAASL